MNITTKEQGQFVTEKQRAKHQSMRNMAYVNAQAVLKQGDRIRVTKCPGTKRWITFAGWDRHAIVSKSGINDYSPMSVDRVNDHGVDFCVETTLAFEWHESFHRSRRVRVAPCPEQETSNYRGAHELTVANCFPDDLSHVYCTCGWDGPGAETDEAAVVLHNTPHGFGLDPVSEWEVFDQTLDDSSELPF